ncbi:hypothetical protein FRC00_003109 [Tulasnella sp. 408]|nr:hypothetical protein FRC00_003109 [Tulasnella sp. 408]
MSESDGKQQPLCERDYFRRLNLICARCGQALWESYFTAGDKKYHGEHFTCSVCPTLFGSQDPYYEHNGDLYCHFHYSTRVATKCFGCGTAILKRFGETNHKLNEYWHPACDMINKFWNVRVASQPTESLGYPGSKAYAQEEAEYDAITLKENQTRTETLVNRIWTHLSAFEESCAACNSNILRHISNGMHLDAIRMTEKLILHVEVLFAVIDELEVEFARAGTKGMSHVREAWMLCRKTVALFTVWSHTQGSSSPSAPLRVQSKRMGMIQDPVFFMAGSAHHLKILIRIALTGALTLEREYSNGDALLKFLERLQRLGMDGADPNAKRQQHIVPENIANISAAPESGPLSPLGVAEFSGSTTVDNSEGVTYGYKSLSPGCAGESPFSPLAIAQAGQKGTSSVLTPPTDLCVVCGEVAAVASPKGEDKAAAAAAEANPKGTSSKNKKPSKVSSAGRPHANVDNFRYEQITLNPTSSSDKIPQRKVLILIYCTVHATSHSRDGFSRVSRLEQYAFLLNVGLRRLYLLLHKRGVLHLPESNIHAFLNQFRLLSQPKAKPIETFKMRSSAPPHCKPGGTARVPKKFLLLKARLDAELISLLY